jgi:hypothetical protein
MPQGNVEYGRLVERALRTVVRDVLTRLAVEGLPAPHHFYITFRTNDPGVEIAPFLHERYPSEMTIVLQYQYWDLEVDDEGFSVTLSFNETPQRLRIPFTALKVFADPGAEFGLQFTIEDDRQVVPLAAAGRLGDAAERPLLDAPGDGASESAASETGGAEIVTLDRFRKK